MTQTLLKIPSLHGTNFKWYSIIITTGYYVYKSMLKCFWGQASIYMNNEGGKHSRGLFDLLCKHKTSLHFWPVNKIIQIE